MTDGHSGTVSARTPSAMRAASDGPVLTLGSAAGGGVRVPGGATTMGRGGGAVTIGGGGPAWPRASRPSGRRGETTNGRSVHAARRARAQLAAARAAATTLSWSADESLSATDKNYNRFPGQSDE